MFFNNAESLVQHSVDVPFRIRLKTNTFSVVDAAVINAVVVIKVVVVAIHVVVVVVVVALVVIEVVTAVVVVAAVVVVVVGSIRGRVSHPKHSHGKKTSH